MTVSQPPILAAEQRAWNYWFVDGLTNLVVGANILIFSFCLFDPMHWLPRPLGIGLSVVAMLLYVLVGTRYQKIVEWLKTRTTYPRTGYVEPPTDNPALPAVNAISLQGNDIPPEVQMLRMQRRTTWTIAVALAAVASFAFVVIHERWMWTASSALFSAAMIVARRDFRMTWIPPLGFPILGLCLTIFAPPHTGSAWFLAGMGLLFVLDGATTLIRYIMQNPKPKVPAQ